MKLLGSPLPLDERRVVEAIARAEERTSGEIRVVVSARKIDDPVAAAKEHFERLGMTRTAERNGVLIFAAAGSHTFAVIGDQGIHEKCGDAFWRALADTMTEHFKRGDHTGALLVGIERAATLLAQHFPRRPDDRNELPNELERH